MRQAGVAVRTKQISIASMHSFYLSPSHLGWPGCAHACVKCNHLSPANERNTFIRVLNRACPGNRHRSRPRACCVRICVGLWTFVYPREWTCVRSRAPRVLFFRGGWADRWHCVKQSHWDAVKGAAESMAVKITQSGANEHGSANRGTCQEITPALPQQIAALLLGEPLPRPPVSSGFFSSELLHRLSYLHLELRST